MCAVTPSCGQILGERAGYDSLSHLPHDVKVAAEVMDC
jgi:hypothetical protein